MNMPLDFALYIVATIVVTGVVCIFVVAGIGWAAKKVRRHNEQAAKAKAAVAAARERGYVVLDEEDGLTDPEVTAMLDAVFGPEILATRPFGEPDDELSLEESMRRSGYELRDGLWSTYDDRNRWAS